jgi:predicted PurR-regulated permease PerM
MKSTPQRALHPSYQLHRRQVAWQIILPIVLAGLLMIGFAILVGLSTFRGNGDVSRWAAISTIWLVLPVMLAGLLVLVALIGLAYLLGRLAGLIPPYSRQAQVFAYRVEAGAKRVQYMGHRPSLIFGEIGTLLKTALKKGVETAREKLAERK